jgi:hypothetical protein
MQTNEAWKQSHCLAYIIAIVAFFFLPACSSGLDQLLAGLVVAQVQVPLDYVHGLLAGDELPHAVRGHDHELVVVVALEHLHLRLGDHAHRLHCMVACGEWMGK